MDSRTRATAVAITLFAVNLIGIGLGPTLAGALSSVLKGFMLSGADLGLSIEACKVTAGLAADQAAACTSANARALQWTIVIFAKLYGWAALHYLLAGKTLTRDMLSKTA